MKVTVDRFEGGFAVCEKEDSSMLNVPLGNLPPDVKEGDILELTDNGAQRRIDETARRRAEMTEKFRKLIK